ncbi:MAG: carboxypeptidase-like regulatory domain-containing protein, partial [Bacteroidota bacterium]
EDIEINERETSVPPPTIRRDSSSTISGKVLDQSGNPITGAEITFLGVGTVFTDAENFGISIDDPGAGGTFRVRKEGYFDAWREFIPESNRRYRTNIVLNTNQPQGTINAQTGGSFTSSDGVSIRISPGSVRDNGEIYTGEVNVAIAYMDPTDDRSLLQSPGNLLSVGERVLATFGMVDVALTSEEGAPLRLAADAPAELSLPRPNELSAGELDSLILWELVESRWNGIGSFSQRPRSISAWIFGGGTFNCDVPAPRAIVCARILGNNGIPLAYQPFSLSFSFGSARVFTFRTDHLGRFCANLPRNTPVDLIVLSECPGEEEYRIQLGSYSDYGPNEFGDVQVDYTPRSIPLSVSWCPGNRPFTEEDGLIWTDGYLFNSSGVFATNGAGEGQITLPACTSDPATLLIQAVANDQRRTSRLISRSSQDLDDLSLSVCTELAPDEYYTVSIEGNQYNFNEVSYLLAGSFTSPYRHQFWGEANNTADTVEVFVSTPQLNTREYSSDEASVSVLNYQLDTGFGYPCTSECSDFVVEITNTGPDEAWVEGTFSYTAAKLNLATREVIADNIPITGTFRLNR